MELEISLCCLGMQITCCHAWCTEVKWQRDRLVRLNQAGWESFEIQLSRTSKQHHHTCIFGLCAGNQVIARAARFKKMKQAGRRVWGSIICDMQDGMTHQLRRAHSFPFELGCCDRLCKQIASAIKLNSCLNKAVSINFRLDLDV